MQYMALYRRFRPRRFEQVVGQKAVTAILKHQAQTGRVAHAYLFCGPRGTGKTSVAQILALAVRCLSPQDGEPCLECAACKEQLEGRSVDVVEMDAASNNSVDDIRDLLERVRLSPVRGDKKVYIVDEVHMLSTGAFNALLKTLEEPPGHVLFVLATTEVQKLPATIISRCQRMDFGRISVQDMTDAMLVRLQELGVEAQRAGVELIARLAGGGMRDAYGLLDQCLASGCTQLTQEQVSDTLGLARRDTLRRVALGAAQGEVAGALMALDEAMDAGKDPALFLRELLGLLRGGMLLAACKALSPSLQVGEEERKDMQALADVAPARRLAAGMELLIDAEPALRRSGNGRIVLEATVARLCYADVREAELPFLARIEALERQYGQATPSQPGEGLVDVTARVAALERRVAQGASPVSAAADNAKSAMAVPVPQALPEGVRYSLKDIPEADYSAQDIPPEAACGIQDIPPEAAYGIQDIPPEIDYSVADIPPEVDDAQDSNPFEVAAYGAQEQLPADAPPAAQRLQPLEQSMAAAADVPKLVSAPALAVTEAGGAQANALPSAPSVHAADPALADQAQVLWKKALALLRKKSIGAATVVQSAKVEGMAVDMLFLLPPGTDNGLIAAALQTAKLGDPIRAAVSEAAGRNMQVRCRKPGDAPAAEKSKKALAKKASPPEVQPERAAAKAPPNLPLEREAEASPPEVQPEGAVAKVPPDLPFERGAEVPAAARAQESPEDVRALVEKVQAVFGADKVEVTGG